MSRLPAHVARHAHLVGGVECTPAPRTSMDGLGVAALALALHLVPGCVWWALAWLAPQHFRIVKEE